MRYVYIGLIVAAVMLVLTFKVQNLEMVTVSLLGAGFRLPMSLLLAAVYVLGMFTGGALFGLIRTWAKGAMRKDR